MNQLNNCDQTNYNNQYNCDQTNNNNQYNYNNKHIQNNFSEQIQKKNKPQQIKKSIGIACIKFVNGSPHILMIRKRSTYAYSEFIYGNHRSIDMKNVKTVNNKLIEMFNKMTLEEKLDIKSLNFGQMWYRVSLNGGKPPIYMNARNRFEMTFLTDGGNKLKKLLNRSSYHASRVWEIPKGRKKNRNESDINCAIREFGEETNISKKTYRLIPNISKSYSFTGDDGILYHNTYHIGIIKNDIEPEISLSSEEQLSEISDIRWMNIIEVKCIIKDQQLYNFIRSIFKMVKRLRKKYKT